VQQFAVEKALSEGAPITCATCRFYHEGNGHCGQDECGGPGGGRDFPSYDGPIPREKLVERCLVCGSTDTRFVIVGLPTKFSLCAKDKDVFQFVGSPDNSPLKHPVTVVAIS
jgi:hypothetical protein